MYEMRASPPPRHSYRAPRRAALVLLAALPVLILAGVAQAQRTRQGTLVFAGLQSATTCIPGPIRTGESTSYRLQWEPAKERGTRSERIVYNVYQSTKPGGEDLSKPTYTTAAGATSFETPKLPVEESFFFVVRARDPQGNEDSNTVEREGQNLCA
jgi:hypothetical protein